MAPALAGFALAACVYGAPRVAESGSPRAATVDRRATKETRALFANLRTNASRQILFGHQDDLAYGVLWQGEPGRSDVKEVAGAYPAVYGWDVGHLELGSAMNLDSVRFSDMRRWIGEGYARGGVITLSWHPDNPVSGGSAWDTTAAVAKLLPGGSHHATYAQWLDRLSDFILSLRAPSGEPIPVVFRPLHEMSGGWFWWGRGHTSSEDYIRLWRFTVEYMRDRKGVHNVLWAYSPNASDDFEARYMETYPGDAYVDVLGLDEYFWPPRAGSAGDPAAKLAEHLAFVVTQAEARGKIPALTETGYETIPEPTWWTGTLLRGLKANPAASRIAWILTWRNGNRAALGREHFYAPYPGHASAADFVLFTRDPLIALGDEIPDLYR